MIDIPQRPDFSLKECAFYFSERYPDKYSNNLASARRRISMLVSDGELKTFIPVGFKVPRVKREDLVKILA